MTAAEPPEGHSDPAHRPIPQDRLHRIFRAGRGKPAGGRSPARDIPLIHTQQSCQNVPHETPKLHQPALTREVGQLTQKLREIGSGRGSQGHDQGIKRTRGGRQQELPADLAQAPL